MSDTDAAREVAERYCAAWLANDLGGIVACYADDFTLHYFGDNPFSGDHVGRDAALATLLAVGAKAPRRLLEIEDVLAGPGTAVVVAREEITTSDGPVEVRRSFRYRVRGERFVESWLYEEDQETIDRAWSDGPGAELLPERRFGWWDMFVAEEDDPRVDGDFANDERSVLLGFLGDRRLTLEMKCAGLDAEQMARASVPPSDLSLLGLVRHLTGVERYWFRKVIAGEDVADPYRSPDGANLEFVVEPDPAMVEEAWANWRAEVAASDAIVARTVDLGERGRGEPTPLREVLVHLIREYAQHLGHADLLRERIDGRIGQ